MSKQTPPLETVIEKEMALTKADFLRGLPRALDGNEYRLNGAETEVTVDAGGGQRLTIQLGAERERRIALLRLPAMTVRLIFLNYSDDRRTELVQMFDRAFQRGGG